MPPPGFPPPNLMMPPPGFSSNSSAGGMAPHLVGTMGHQPQQQSGVAPEMWVETKSPEGKVRLMDCYLILCA